VDKIKICFLIRRLNDGGAQRQLLSLISGLDKARFGITVMTFYSGGRFSDELKQFPSVEHITLIKKRRWDVVCFLFHLTKQIRRSAPDILHGYLGTSNILTVFLKPLLRRTQIVWGIRASNMDLSQYDWLARLHYRLECFLARFADLIIVNSFAGLSYHCLNGFPKERMIVIPNGIDTEQFTPDPCGRRRVRTEWGIEDDKKLIGLVGRLDPIKDHPTFLKAAALLLEKRSDVRFVIVGDGPQPYKQKLQNLSQNLGLTRQLIWGGARSDMSAVQNAFDIAALSSTSEGFPNVVGEAMACGVPCVVTDVGDSKWIIGDTGIVVSPGDPLALSRAWQAMIPNLNDLQARLGEKTRLRIVEHFGIDTLISKTEEALTSLVRAYQ